MSKRRKYGSGTLRLRKDGRWEGRIVVGYDDKNLPITKTVTAKTKGECEEKLEKLKETIITNTSKKAKPSMPFGEWMDFWYQTYCKPGIRPTTQLGYEDRIYKHVIPSIGHIPLNKLTQTDLQQFYAKLKTSGRLIRQEAYGEGLSDRMVRSCHASCRTALEKAVSEGLIRINPSVGCKLPPKKSKEMQILTHGEMQRFLMQAKAEGYFELFLLELSTGMRRGEILALQWDDLNTRTGELRIERQVYPVNGKNLISAPKTKASNRTIVLPPEIVEILVALRKHTKSRWMFPSPVIDDSPLNPPAVRKRLQIILKRSGCKHVRFHDLRHTFATMALENGMDVKTLSTTIGHISSATTLNIYSHVTDTMQRQAAINIDRGIGGTNAEMPTVEVSDQSEAQSATVSEFKPNFNRRRAGTGCVTMINDHLYEGRYTPTNADGKRIARNVYASTKEECEEKLAELIKTMKAEIAEEKARRKAENESN